MKINWATLELNKWFIKQSLEKITMLIINSKTDYYISVFINSKGNCSFCVSSQYESFIVDSTIEFYHVCDANNIGIIKEVITMFKIHLHHNGFDGVLKIGQIL